jgi:hypothetical protein
VALPVHELVILPEYLVCDRGSSVEGLAIYEDRTVNPVPVAVDKLLVREPVLGSGAVNVVVKTPVFVPDLVNV